MDEEEKCTPHPNAPAENPLNEPVQDRFLRICDSLPLAVFETVTDDSSLYINLRWTEITGQVADQFGGHGWRDAIHPSDREWVLEEVELARGQDRMFDADFRVQRSDGSIRWVHGRSLPLYKSDGTHDGFVHAIYDITDRRLVEQKLRKSLADLKDEGDAQSEKIRNAVAQLRDLVEEVSELGSSIALVPERLRKSLDAAEAALDELSELAPEEVEDHSLDDVLF